MLLGNITGVAGQPSGPYLSIKRDIFYSARNLATYIPGPVVVDGTASGNPQNTPYVAYLFAGQPVGKITSSGLYATSILGTLDGAYTSGGTSLTVSAATATELVRRIGSSGTGTFKVVGPPTAAGTVAATAVTYSAVNTTTGVITVTSLGVNKIAGSWICPADGSETIITLIADQNPVQVVAVDGITRLNVEDSYLWAGGGIINTAYIWPSYPTDTSLRAYLKAAIRVNIPGAEFSDDLING